MRTHKLVLASLAIGAAILAGSAAANGQTPAPAEKKTPVVPPSKPADAPQAKPAHNGFAMQAADDGMAEVEHGKLAASKATSDDVKKFGQRMVDDHSKANDELMKIAAQKSITLPKETSARHKAFQDKLSKASGAAFDQMYMAHMVEAHTKAVSLFEKEAKGGSDADLKAFAEKSLPTLREHLKMAKSLASKSKS